MNGTIRYANLPNELTEVGHLVTGSFFLVDMGYKELILCQVVYSGSDKENVSIFDQHFKTLKQFERTRRVIKVKAVDLVIK